MDNKDLITRFAEDCFRFEALHQEIDGLIADADSEVLAYEYEDLANQAAEIVLKLSANGNNVGENFYRYYVERLEYIIDYFRALLDYEETPLAEDEPNELEDEPGAVEEDDSEDDDLTLPPGVEEKPANLWLGWDKLTWEERRRVKDSVALFYRLDDITAQDDESPAAPILTLADSPHTLLRHYIRFATAQSILAEESELRRLLWKAIDAIPDFRDSEEFKTIIEEFPTYKEIEQ